eukprot:4270552-Prymnesium_polylepis.1
MLAGPRACWACGCWECDETLGLDLVRAAGRRTLPHAVGAHGHELKVEDAAAAAADVGVLLARVPHQLLARQHEPAPLEGAERRVGLEEPSLELGERGRWLLLRLGEREQALDRARR